MPRKSAQQRLTEGKELQEMYEKAGLTETWGYGFINSIIGYLERGKQLSKRQRTTFDDMIVEGVPTPKGDKSLLEKIDAASEHWKGNPDRDWESGVLSSMRRNVFKGWSLSDKQSALLEKVLQRHTDDVLGKNDFQPTPGQLSDLEILVQLYEGYATPWRMERPALSRAVERTVRFLSGDTHIEKYHYDKLMKAMGSRLKKYRNPRFKRGDLSQLISWASSRGSAEKNTVIFCMSDAYISEKGEIVNDWMVPNEGVKQINQDTLPKRLKG